MRDSKGVPYTWTNNREGNQRISERLDRALVNPAFIGRYPTLRVTHKLLLGSDHCPLLVQLEPKVRMGRRRFRFEGSWMEQTGCVDVVKEAWQPGQGQGGQTQIHNNLGRCRIKLTKWSKENRVNYKKRIEELQTQLAKIQGQHGRNINSNEEARVKALMEDAWKQEEEFWRQKSRVQWLRGGDRNTRFFHQATMQRRRGNQIRRIQRVDGTWTEDKEIQKECEQYFRKIFTS